MSIAVKIKINKTIVKPVVVYGSEILAVTEMDTKRLSKWERKILRRIYGAVVGEGVWIIGTNHELREL